jgi:protein-L-isoaspartate(D-aspartate) O-methyltransferase
MSDGLRALARRGRNCSLPRRLLAAALVLGGTPLAACGAEPDEAWFDRARLRMVAEQLRGRDISDARVLAAMARVPRHDFVDATYRHRAYDDSPLPIGHGQTISQPYIVALMTQLLELKGTERVLEVGTGSGYQAAVLAETAAEVFSIEIVEPLARTAAARLKALGYHRVAVRAGDGYAGWPDRAPFHGILVTAAAGRIPPALLAQLAEGGRLVMPVGDAAEVQRLMVAEKRGGTIQMRPTIPVRFVPLVVPREGP